MNKENAVFEKLVEEIAEAREDIKKGRVYTAQQVRKELWTPCEYLVYPIENR